MSWQILGIAGLATAGVILRPFHWPEAIWAVAGAALLVLAGLLPASAAWSGVARGADVYMFLTGMMLLSEAARREGLFDFLAAEAAKHARGSAKRLFLLVYLVGVLVTVFLSNDATAVVLTPAVFAATQAAKVEKPLPYLYICAFVANAASFVLPISNPANLVVYGRAGLPPLLDWLRAFALPSLAAIGVTYARPAALPAPRTRRRHRRTRGLPAPHRRRQGRGAPGSPGRRWSCCSRRRAASILGRRRWRPARRPRRSSCWFGARVPCRCCAMFIGACCRWWRACSSWSRRSTGPA